MKKFLSVFVVVAATLPVVAEAQQRLSREQLMQLAVERETCDDREVIDAKYDEQDASRIIVTCGEDAAGFVPLAAGLGLGGAGAAVAGLALVAAAAGGGSTPSTTSTD